MISSHLVGLFLATVAIAAPVITERDLNSTIWTPEHTLQPDEVILYGEGRMEIVAESVYRALLLSEGLSLDAPKDAEAFLNATGIISPHTNNTKSDLHKRDDCAHTNVVITDRSETFVDWDVQMSPVVIGTGNGIDVYVSSGYTVSNSISVSAGLDWTFVKDKLKGSFGIDYSRSWSTQTVINIKGTVPNGYSGVMITRPIKTRRFGRTFNGCIGSRTQTGDFMADSYAEGSYSGVSWVSGAITMCTKREFPLSRCNGGGNFI